MVNKSKKVDKKGNYIKNVKRMDMFTSENTEHLWDFLDLNGLLSNFKWLLSNSDSIFYFFKPIIIYLNLNLSKMLRDKVREMSLPKKSVKNLHYWIDI